MPLRLSYMYHFPFLVQKTYTFDTAVDGWKNWKLPEVTGINVTDGEMTVGIWVRGAAKGWGTIDDACVYPAE